VSFFVFTAFIYSCEKDHAVPATANSSNQNSDSSSNDSVVPPPIPIEGIYVGKITGPSLTFYGFTYDPSYNYNQNFYIDKLDTFTLLKLNDSLYEIINSYVDHIKMKLFRDSTSELIRDSSYCCTPAATDDLLVRTSLPLNADSLYVYYHYSYSWSMSSLGTYGNGNTNLNFAGKKQ